jgi:hypothetical protein
LAAQQEVAEALAVGQEAFGGVPRGPEVVQLLVVHRETHKHNVRELAAIYKGHFERAFAGARGASDPWRSLTMASETVLVPFALA